ncbi:MAG: HIT family protein [Halieaceae bacterium]|jgi:diadenosine tetraphosphate (Ap4A) HIT family hydrolase|nr:HIT family protein [Halieaceae bacterium]
MKLSDERDAAKIPVLHPQLASDCHQLGRLASGRLLLHRNASLHWFLIVPDTEERDLLDLGERARNQLLADAASLHRYLKDALAYPRVNVGALGLVVPQLHLHVVGRREDDPCWPAPVWGRLPDGPSYGDEELARLRTDLLPRAVD